MELKKGLFFGSLAVAMMAVTSCSQDDAIAPSASNEAAFSTSIRPVQTRIDAWSGSEQVGVYMVSGSDFASSNVAYDVAASGDLTASVSGINYPATGSVAFKAYYPYASGNGATVAIDLTDGNTADHDLIFAETTADYNAATTDKVQLTFRHQLAKLSLKMAETKVSAPAVSYKVNGLSAATFDVATGTVTNGTATAEMTPDSNGDLIVLPGQSVSSVVITIDGQNYTWDASAVNFTKNMQTKYELSIDGDAVTATLIASIEDWTQDDGSGTVEPQPTQSVIGKIRDMYNPAEDVIIAEDMIVTASVVLVDGSNIHISDGVKGIDLYEYDLRAMNFSVGDEITFNANGAKLTAYKGLVELKSQGDYELGTAVTKTGNTKVIAPVVVSASDIADYMSMYVTIADAKAAAGAPATWGTEGQYVTVDMNSASGDFVVSTSKYSSFINSPVGTGTGNVSGVVGYHDVPQLIFALESDFAALSDGSSNPSAATLSATPSKTDAVAAGESIAVAIATNSAWTAVLSNNTANATLSLAAGTGDASVNVVFPENTEETAKGVTLTVSVNGAADAVVTFTQAAKAGSGQPANVVTFPVTFDFSTDTSSAGVFPASAANTMATLKTYNANDLTWSEYTGGYVKGNGFQVNSGWEFTLPVSNLTAGAVLNFKSTMKSSKTGPGKFVVQYSVDGGTNFVSTSNTIEFNGDKDNEIDVNITVAEGLASGNLIIRLAIEEDISAGRVADAEYANATIGTSGSSRFYKAPVVISLGADS